MKITLNGEPRQISANNLDALLDECGFSGRIATAVNGEFVPALARQKQKLSDGDQIEVVAPMQGG